MRLTVIGSSPAWPNPGSAHAGYVVESRETDRLLLDCGPGVLGRLRAHDMLPVAAIAITHLHLDHWGDLVPWAWITLHVAKGPRPVLWLPPGASVDLATFGARFGYQAMFEDAFHVREYAPQVPFAAAGFELVPIPVEHFDMDAFGFRVCADGRVLAYSGDTGPCTALAELARGADLFLCEATLRDGADDSNPRGHLSAAEALSIPSARTLLTHRPAELRVPEGAEQASDALGVEL